MKILYFTQFLATTGGGGDVVFLDLAKGMIKLGHEVHIICHMMTNPDANNLEGANVHKIKPVIQDKAGYFLTISEHIMYVVNALKMGSWVIRNQKIDIIHSNTISPVIPATLLGKIYNIPALMTVHDVYTATSSNYWKQWSSQEKVSRISSFVAPLYEKTVLRMPVTRIHAVSNATMEDLLEINPRADVSIIYNGIDLDAYSNSNFAASYEKFVLYVGRLIITKNLEIVILAFIDVIKKIPDAKLVIVGEGPMRNKWERVVKDNNLSNNIEFRGYVTEKIKQELLARCSALVFPSLVEGFGLVILEAFAMSKPVLVADVKPFDEIVDEGRDGFLVPPENSYRWSERIVTLLSNKKLCEKMGQTGKLKVKEKYNGVFIHKKMEELYTELLTKKKR